jgi:PAS domain S-box-containing protein
VSSSRRTLPLILIMVATSLAATGASLALLYDTAFEQAQTRLTETVRSQARLIEAVARFDRQSSELDDPAGALGATISQIKDAHDQFAGLGETGEIVMARLEEGNITFVLRQRHSTSDQTMSIPLESQLAEPMRLALSGQAGSIVGLDYRGETVLAAYEPISSLEMGIVTKIDIAEIRAPFVRAGMLASLIALLLIAAGSILFLRIEGTMARQISASDTRIQTLLGSSPVCIHEISLAGKLTRMNRAGLTMLGLEDESEIIGMDYLSIPIAADQERVRGLFERACSGDTCEFSFSAGSDDARMFISSSFIPIRGENGKIARLMGISQDVTKAKATETALILSENRYRDLYSNAEVAILEEDFSKLWNRFEQMREEGVIDLAAALESGEVSAHALAELIVIRDANKAALELFGADSMEPLLTSVAKTLGPWAIETFKKELRALWMGEESFRSETEHESLRGERLQVIISISLPQSAEAAHSVPVTIMDVTKQRETEETLRRSQKMDAIGQLAGGIAHDFNNLMAIMMGHSEILGTIVGEDERAQQSVGALARAVERGASLTQRLLTFSRQQTHEPTLADPGTLVEGLRDLLGRTLGEAIDLTIHADPATWSTKIDVNQLEHAIINLAINSHDAMPRGGALSIRAFNITIHEAETGKFRDVPPGDYARIEVKDSGFGIPPEHMDRVFDPFFTTKEIGQGTGLGLSTVYGFVKQSMGHIFVESEPGCGTCFQILLPRHHGARDVEQSTESASAPTRGGDEFILVVEDDPSVREIAVEILGGRGYRVHEAGNGKEAIEILSGTTRFALLFTDVVLPGGVDGLQIAEQARRLQPRIAILYTTGYAKDALLDENRAVNRAMVLNKPYRSEELLTATRSILDLHQEP